LKLAYPEKQEHVSVLTQAPEELQTVALEALIPKQVWQ
jgi:hypothetical protein